MQNVPTVTQLATVAAVVGIAVLFGPASESPGQARILMKSPPTLAASQGEAAPNPVDLDGDGIDDSAAFAAALAAEPDQLKAESDTIPVPKSKPQLGHDVVVLRIMHLPCPDTPHNAVADLDAPLQRLSEKTPWVLLAGSDKAPNVTGQELRVLGQPVLEASTAQNRTLVIEPGDGMVQEIPIPVSTLPKGCVAEPTVS